MNEVIKLSFCAVISDAQLQETLSSEGIIRESVSLDAKLVHPRVHFLNYFPGNDKL